MLTLLLVPLMAVLNRFRGGGFGADRLPGHPRFWCAPLAALAGVWAFGSVSTGLVFGACWLVWCWPAWGFLMCCGRWAPQGREISMIEDACLQICRGHVVPALALRHAIGLAPMAVLVSPWALLLAPAIALAYEASWRWAPDFHEIEGGELATGALFGLLLWGLS